MTAYLASLFLLFCSSLAAAIQWDEAQLGWYASHSELQRMWAMRLLFAKPLKGDEMVLDVGCGDGRITRDISFMLPRGKVFGIDPNPFMIQWAKRRYEGPDFGNLHFLEGTLETHSFPVSSFDLVTSFCVLHLLQERVVLLRSIHHLLKEGGVFMAVLPGRTNGLFGQAMRKTCEMPRWKPFFTDHLPAFPPYTEESLTELLVEAGFEPLLVRLVNSKDLFADEQDLVDWCVGTLRQVCLVPESMRQRFASDFVDRFLELSPASRRSNGSIDLCDGHFELLARKGAL